jgi:hypothetical protein
VAAPLFWKKKKVQTAHFGTLSGTIFFCFLKLVMKLAKKTNGKQTKLIGVNFLQMPKTNRKKRKSTKELFAPRKMLIFGYFFFSHLV